MGKSHIHDSININSINLLSCSYALPVNLDILATMAAKRKETSCSIDMLGVSCKGGKRGPQVLTPLALSQDRPSLF